MNPFDRTLRKPLIRFYEEEAVAEAVVVAKLSMRTERAWRGEATA